MRDTHTVKEERSERCNIAGFDDREGGLLADDCAQSLEVLSSLDRSPDNDLTLVHGNLYQTFHFKTVRQDLAQ